MNHFLKTAGLICILIGIATNVLFMLKNGEPNSFTWYLIALPFLIWTTLPFAAVFLMMKKANNVLHTYVIFFLSSAIISSGGIWILYDAFVINLDPQSGLIFIFLPILQLIIAAVGFLAGILLNRLLKIRV